MPWHPIVRCRLKEGRHPLGGTGAASATQGLGGISSVAGLETKRPGGTQCMGYRSMRKHFCPHLCRHSEISATSSSGRVAEVRIRWRNRQKTTHSEGSSHRRAPVNARRDMRATRSGIPSRPPIGPRTPPRIRRGVTPVRTTRTPAAVVCCIGQANPLFESFAKERSNHYERADRSRARGDPALPPEPRVRRPGCRRRGPLRRRPGRPARLLGRPGPHAPPLGEALHPTLDWSNPFAKWFDDGELNVAVNCLDRHVEAGLGDRVALLWEGEPGTRGPSPRRAHRRGQARGERPGRPRHRRARSRRHLPPDDPRGRGGDARLRAHRRHPLRWSSAGSAPTASPRASTTPRHPSSSPPTAATGGARRAPLKPVVDEALARTAGSVRSVLVVKRGENEVEWTDGRDLWWHEAVAGRAEHEARRSTPSTRCSSSTPRAPPGSRRASCTPPAGT